MLLHDIRSPSSAQWVPGRNTQTASALKYRFGHLSTYLSSWFLRRGSTFWDVYVYFRWIDDIVDDPEISHEFKLEFLQSRRDRFSGDFGLVDTPGSSLTYEERLMRRAIGSMGNQRGFCEQVLQMLDTFEFDIRRFGGRRVSRDDLLHYSRCMGAAYAHMLCYIINLSASPSHFHAEFADKCGKDFIKALSQYAHYCHLVHMLRDYSEDLQIGYDNVPLECATIEDFAQEVLHTVLPKFKAVEYEHFILLLKYRVSVKLAFVMFFYYFRFVQQLLALQRGQYSQCCTWSTSFPIVLCKFVRNQFYCLDTISAEESDRLVRHQKL